MSHNAKCQESISIARKKLTGIHVGSSIGNSKCLYDFVKIKMISLSLEE